MAQVYIIMGESGEYDDHREWVVAAFQSRKRAEAFVKRANAWLLANRVHREDCPGMGYLSLRNLINPYDPCWSLDHTGVSYTMSAHRLDPPLPNKRQGA